MTVLAPARERFRWTILALISVSHIIGASAQYGINTLAPFYKDELGRPDGRHAKAGADRQVAQAVARSGCHVRIAPAPTCAP